MQSWPTREVSSSTPANYSSHTGRPDASLAAHRLNRTSVCANVLWRQRAHRLGDTWPRAAEDWPEGFK